MVMRVRVTEPMGAWSGRTLTVSGGLTSPGEYFIDESMDFLQKLDQLELLWLGGDPGGQLRSRRVTASNLPQGLQDGLEPVIQQQLPGDILGFWGAGLL
jgi:hypothetical protein